MAVHLGHAIHPRADTEAHDPMPGKEDATDFVKGWLARMIVGFAFAPYTVRDTGASTFRTLNS